MAAVISTWGGLLVLALVCAFCAAFAAAARCPAALLPLPVLAGCAMALLLFGYAGALHLGLLLIYAALLAGTVYFGFRAGQRAVRQALLAPGLLFFAAAGAFFWLLFAVRQPMFTQWDEFTFWGAAAKMLKQQNMLYCAAPGNLIARAGMPGMALVSYFFQGLSGRFSEWQCLAAYDILFMACAAAASALPRAKKTWHLSVLTLGAAVLLPFFFGVVTAGTASTVYQNTMADVPLAMQFGGVLCLWFAAGGGRRALTLTALPLALLTATKDMGFAYALIAVFVIFAGELAAAGRPGRRSVGHSLAKAALLCLPVLAVFLSWSRYYAFVTAGESRNAVGSENLGYGAILAGGLKQLLGIGREEKFARLMQLMGGAFLTRRVCLLGSGLLAVAAITAVAAAAFLAAPKGAGRRRVAAVWGALAFCFAAFYVFHLILYFYNFSESEALILKDYERYIGPYYCGWMLAMLGLLAQSAAAGRSRLGGGLLGAAAAAVAVLFFWRGVPASGFWDNSNCLYELRQDVQVRAAAANAKLDWNDKILVLSQGDNGYRWYYYNYELTATVVAINGGDADTRWDTQFANLVESANWDKYEYQAVCTPALLVEQMRAKQCDYLLIDRADDYLERSFSPLFEGGLTADMPATLYKIVDSGAAAGDDLGMRFVPVAESGGTQ